MIRILVVGLAAVTAMAAQAQDAPKTWTVNPGQSIQEAIDKAAPGDTVQVLPGEYVQTVRVNKAIVLKGLEYEGEQTTLKAKLNEEDEPLALAIHVNANGATVEGFVVRGFRSGVHLDNCKGATLRSIAAEEIEQVGVAVQFSREIALGRIVASSAEASAVSISNSTTVTLTDSEMFASVWGLMVTSCEGVTVSNSSFHHNRTGVYAHNVGDTVTSYLKLFGCRIMGNNRVHESHTGGEASNGTHGIGVLLLGVSHTDITRCVIAENNTMGIITTSAMKGQLAHYGPGAEAPGVASEHTYIHHNRYFNNGGLPYKKFADLFPGIPAGDLYWDGRGERNQWQENTELKTYPEKLVVKQGGVHTDVIHFQ